MLVDSASAHCCAFCKHWFDPCCNSISPRDLFGKIWEVQKTNQNPCVLNHIPKSAMQSCSDFEMKL